MVSLVDQSLNYIKNLMSSSLPRGLLFHNIQHTMEVVQASYIIGSETLKNEQQIVEIMLAACFHDSGFIHCYSDHETASAHIAEQFLRSKELDSAKVERISQLILSTQLQVAPQNMSEKILKDADMFHLSKSNYIDYMSKLRQEWSIVLKKEYAELEWLQLNYSFLKKHKYHTDYANKYLQPKKEKNIKMLKEQHLLFVAL